MAEQNGKKEGAEIDRTETVWCDVCSCVTTGQASYEQHVTGSRHMKNVQLRASGDKPVNTGPSRGKSVMPTAKSVIDKCTKPLIGVHSVTRIMREQHGAHDQFICETCSTSTFDVNGLGPHLMGRTHRLAYLKANYQDYHKAVMEKQDDKAEQNRMLESYALEIEKKEGHKPMKFKKGEAPIVPPGMQAPAVTNRGRGAAGSTLGKRPYSGNDDGGYGKSSRGRGDSYGRGRGDSYGRGRGDSYGRGRGDSYGRGRGDSFGRGYGDSFGRGRGDSYGRGRGDPYGSGRGDSYGRGRGDPYGSGRGDMFGRGGYSSRGGYDGHDAGYGAQNNSWSYESYYLKKPLGAFTPAAPEAGSGEDKMDLQTMLRRVIKFMDYDTICSEDEARLALQVSNGLSEALMKYRSRSLPQARAQLASSAGSLAASESNKPAPRATTMDYGHSSSYGFNTPNYNSSYDKSSYSNTYSTPGTMGSGRLQPVSGYLRV